jgi:hypothetical protein
MSRVIGQDSPFNRLPVGLDAGQRGWIEGLRFSIEIADLAMRRLGTVLYGLAGQSHATQTLLEPDAYTAAITDAWTFVDAAWRLKRFILDGRLPISPGHTPPLPYPDDRRIQVDGFKKAIAGVQAVRDGFQHIDDRAAGLAKRGETVWGYLSWAVLCPEKAEAQTCVLVSGSSGPDTTDYSMVNPIGKPFHGPIDHITLHAHQHTVDMSELHRQIAILTRKFEDVFRPQFGELPVDSSAVLLSLTVSVAGKAEQDDPPPRE